jgi:hypothetical protein
MLIALYYHFHDQSVHGEEPICSCSQGIAVPGLQLRRATQ